MAKITRERMTRDAAVAAVRARTEDEGRYGALIGRTSAERHWLEEELGEVACVVDVFAAKDPDLAWALDMFDPETDYDYVIEVVDDPAVVVRSVGVA